MNEGRREEARMKWLEGRLDWIESRWGSEFAQFVAWHDIRWGHLDAAEAWAGIQWGMIGKTGPQTLDQVAAMEDEDRDERIESQATMALAHGM